MSDQVHTDHLVKSLGKLLKSGKHSDLTIVCRDGVEYNVHKIILCARSDVFERECKSQMQEGQTNVIRHEQFDSDTVGMMIAYLYKNDYALDERVGSSRHDGVSGPANPLLNIHQSRDVNEGLKAHIRVYAIAGFYDVGTLRTLAVERFRELSQSAWDPDGFAEVIYEACSFIGPADRGMRDAVLSHALKHRLELVKNGRFMQCMSELGGVQEFLVLLLANAVDTRWQEGKRRKVVGKKAPSHHDHYSDPTEISIWDPLEPQAETQPAPGATECVVGWDDYSFDS